MTLRLSNTDGGRANRFFFALPFLLMFVSGAKADFTDTTWRVTGFSGEPWFINTSALIGESQSFHGGFAEGVFFNCEFAGMSSTYTTYEPDDFFANPEFELFAAHEEGMRLSTTRIFVHRITCEGGDDPLRRQVMYPFVTNEARKSAWYLFEGGVFSLYNP